MTTVDDSIQAGARAIWFAGSTDPEWVASEAARAMWPILSAGLRELADEWVKRNPDEWHRFGAQRGIEASREAHARELVRELDRIDKELGND